MGKKKMTQRDALEKAQAEFKENPPKHERPESLTELTPPEGKLLAGQPIRAFTAGDARLLDRLFPKLPELDEIDAAVLALYVLTREDIRALLAEAEDPAALWANAQVWMFEIPAEEILKHIPLLNEIQKMQDQMGTSDDENVKKKTGFRSILRFLWPF